MKSRRITRGALLTGGMFSLIIVGVAASTYLFLSGSELAALLVSNVLVILVVGSTLALLLHASRQLNASSRSRRREHQKLQQVLEGVGLQAEAGGSDHAVASGLKQLEERQDHLHALTRKRVRDKHNAIQATLGRMESMLVQLKERQDHLHSLTRKRLREKHNATEALLSRMRRRDYEHYATVKQRIERVVKEQSRQADLPVADSREADGKRKPSVADRAALRAFLFEVLESQAHSRESLGSPAESNLDSEREAKDA